MGGILSVKNSSNVLDHAQYDSYQLNVAGSTVDDLQDTLEARLRKYFRGEPPPLHTITNKQKQDWSRLCLFILQT